MKSKTSNNLSLKWKVCGMGTAKNIAEVAGLQPDYMGFIFYEKSPRNFGEAMMIPAIPGEIKKTGVFVNATLEFVLGKTEAYNLNALQLHGEETASYCRQLKEEINKLGRTEIELIKVFSVKEEFDFARLKEYEPFVTYFLFDTQGENKGGNGVTFNWELLKDYPSSTPFFLSGGIGLAEVEKIKSLRAHLQKKDKKQLLHAVDINSKFETAPACKDAKKLSEFKNLLYQS